MRENSVVATGRRDWWLAGLVALATFVVYVRTMLPGVGGSGDSIKFQYLGKVLGTAHPPGYPAYVLVSHLFSYLPLDSLAYRINVMSAFWAAIGAGLTYLLVRRLDGTRTAAATAGLGLALGRYYWGSATVAEVYSMAAALEIATVLKLIDWGLTRRDRDLFAAVAIASFAVGNHLTIAFVVPALILYVLVIDARTAVRPRVLVVTTILVALGVSQYLFVILRTLQHAPAVEASATNLRELWGVMTARRFAYEIFTFSPVEIVRQKVPELLGFARDELRTPALILLLPGTIWLLLRGHWREFLLLATAFLGVFGLTVNTDADRNGFIVPTIAFAWPVVGLGVAALSSVASRRVGRIAGVVVGAVTALLVVGSLGLGNFRASDHSHRVFEAHYADALFNMLPRKTALVQEGYSLDQLWLYKLLGERAGEGRDIQLVSPEPTGIRDLARRGYQVFAFPIGREQLEAYGFEFAPVPARPHLDTTNLPLFTLVAASRCEATGDGGWHDIGAVGDGPLFVRLDDYRPFNARAVLYLAARQPLSPREREVQGTGTPSFGVTHFRNHTPAERRAAESALAADGVSGVLAASALAAPQLARVTIDVNDNGQWVGIRIDAGGELVRALVRTTVDRPVPARARACVKLPF